VRIRGWYHSLGNIRAGLPQRCRSSADSRDPSHPRRPYSPKPARVINHYRKEFPAAVACLELDRPGYDPVRGLTDTFYGMVVLAFLLSIEGVAENSPQPGKDIPGLASATLSALAFFLFIALVRPIDTAEPILKF